MSTRQTYTETKGLIQAIENRAKTLIPQQLEQNYFYYRFKQAGRMVKCHDVVEIPLMTGMPSLGKWIGRGTSLPDATSDQLALSSYNNRYVATPISLDMIDMWENDGNPGAIFKDAEYEAMKAAWGQRRMLSNGIINGSGTLQPDGLIGRILEKSAPSSQTQVVGQVNPATKTWWRNQYVSLTSTFGTIAAGTTLPAGFLALISLIDACTVGQAAPTDLWTAKATFLLIRRGMLETSTAHHLATEEKDRAFGFKTIYFDGLKVGWDGQMPADTVACVHLGGSRMDDRRSGENKSKYDADLEDATVKNLFDIDGSLFMLYNPNVMGRTIQPRSPYRELSQTSWLLNSMNLGVARRSDHGVAGSPNGSNWETW